MAAQDQQAGQDDPQTAQRGVEWSNERPSDGVPAPHLSSLPGTAGLEEQTAAATPLPLKVLVVGGSISGCCTALALQELGCEVRCWRGGLSTALARRLDAMGATCPCLCSSATAK